MLSREERAPATGIRLHGFCVMRADRQTDEQTDILITILRTVTETAHLAISRQQLAHSPSPMPTEAQSTRSTQKAQTSADPEDPDFGLWTPGSEA